MNVDGGVRQRRPAAPRADSAPAARGHEILPHTADAGLRAWAPDLAALFEEAAAALAEIAAEIPEGGGSEAEIELAAPDLVGLAFAWLSELIGLADIRHAALAGTSVRRVDAAPDGCRMEARARFVDRAAGSVRQCHDVKAATYHGLVVVPETGTWRLIAYLDI